MRIGSAPRSLPSRSCLLLWCSKSFCGWTTESWRLSWPTQPICAVIGLKTVPHFTTFQKASRRLLRRKRAQRLSDKTIGIAVRQRRLGRRVKLAALDGTGLESHHASHYYVCRRAKGGKTWQNITYRHFPKAGILCDCQSHLILAVVPGRGPRSDMRHFRAALDQALRRVRIATLTADAGYDSEALHTYARGRRGVRTLISPRIGRPTKKPPSGNWRRQMAAHLGHSRYGQRWQVETVNSMLKRLQDAALRGPPSTTLLDSVP